MFNVTLNIRIKIISRTTTNINNGTKNNSMYIHQEWNYGMGENEYGIS